jgi:HlyD family secretion protein
MRWPIVTVLLVVALGAGAAAYFVRRGGSAPPVTTMTVTLGDIAEVVAATGTLEAITTVQVGSQVSGDIAWLGADFNSVVRKGQVIARLDPSVFQAMVDEARGELEKANAEVLQSEADVLNDRVAVEDAQEKLTRANALVAKDLSPRSDLDDATTALDLATAQLASAQAALRSAQAQVVQSQAALDQNQVGLEHCAITSPIDGTVIQRSVDVGQTVAASLQSPTLFVIAADLARMQVDASVDEADIGLVRPQQTVTFTVDAYPNDTFTGTISQVRLQPSAVQNVTTYSTIVSADNPDLRLKPGMTANIKVHVANRTDVLRVPNAALRFRPSAELFAALGQRAPESWLNAAGGAAAAGLARSSGEVSAGSVHSANDSGSAVVATSGTLRSATTVDALFPPLLPAESGGQAWLYANKQLKAVGLRLGISDGIYTELIGGGLQPGAELVIGARPGV